MTNHIPWPEIHNFHTVRNTLLKYLPEEAKRTINYRAKIKLDGSNAAIIIKSNGHIVTQSRTKIITPSDDNFGFSRWVNESKNKWLQLQQKDKDLVIHGEFFGNGLGKNVASNKLDRKYFAIFALEIKSEYFADDKSFIVEPDIIEMWLQSLLKESDNVFVLPWHATKGFIKNTSTYPILHEINFKWTDEESLLKIITDQINAEIQSIESCDPWIKSTFGIEGIGEGLVFYPLLPTKKDFETFAFKAKGEKHSVVKTKTPAQINPEVAKNVEEFVDLVLTENRLEQGFKIICPDNMFIMKQMGDFLKWIINDIQKECQTELEASGLEWRQINKVLTDKARKWVMSK